MNAFMRSVYAELRCDPTQPLQAREFFGSMTTLRSDALGPDNMLRVLEELGLDAASLAPKHQEADRIVILRHTLMNPFLEDAENDISYIDRYFDYLARRVRALAPMLSSAPVACTTVAGAAVNNRAA